MNRTRSLPALLLLLLPFAAAMAQGFDDEFNSLVMNPGWTLLREDRAHWRFTGTAFQVTTEPGALNGTMFNNVNNILLQAAPSSFRIETRLLFTPDSAFHNAGLIYWQDDDNYVRVSRGMWTNDTTSVNGVWLEWEESAVTGYAFLNNLKADTIFLRLTKTGTLFEGACSRDGITWQLIGQTLIPAFYTEAAKVGLQAANGDGTLATKNRIPATFDWFHIITLGVGDAPASFAAAPRITSVFPNPACSDAPLVADIEAGGNCALQLTDLLGRVLWTARANTAGAQRFLIPTAGLVAGEYLLRVSNESASAVRTVRVF